MLLTDEERPARLFYNCSWKRKASFKCNICGKTNDVQIDMFDENIGYDVAKPGIIEHIIKKHPEYCYRCKKCNKPHCTKADVKKCTHD